MMSEKAKNSGENRMPDVWAYLEEDEGGYTLRLSERHNDFTDHSVISINTAFLEGFSDKSEEDKLSALMGFSSPLVQAAIGKVKEGSLV